LGGHSNGEGGRVRHNAQRGPKTPTLDTWQVVFIGFFCECEEFSFASGAFAAYSACTICRLATASLLQDWSRIIPHTVSQHFPQLIVVSWWR
jgi:hypothetical protein